MGPGNVLIVTNINRNSACLPSGIALKLVTIKSKSIVIATELR